MAVLISTLDVEDYDKWRAVFDEMAEVRSRYGIGEGRVFRHLDSPNTITVILDGEVEGMKAYGQSQELKDALANAGAIGQPRMAFADDVT